MQPSNSQAIYYLNLVNSAYLMFGQDGSNLRPVPINIPPEYFITNYMNSLDPDSGRRVFFGFMARPRDARLPSIVAIRGTYDISEWYTDADIVPVAFPPYSTPQTTVYVEKGFYEFYENIEWLSAVGDDATMTSLQVVDGSQPGLIIVGHSLGGAMATLITAELSVAVPYFNVTLVTAACPATGDDAFAARFNSLVPNSYRYINELDSIASLLDIFYTQVKNGIDLHSLDIYVTPECEHSLLTYIYLLSPSGTACTTDCCILSEDVETRSAVRLLLEMRRKKRTAVAA